MIALTAVAFGLVFGSFANATIDRISHRRSLLGRSRCDRCGRVLRVAELVPVLSFLALRGRCRTCHSSIGARTVIVEAACAAAFGLSFAGFGVLTAAMTCAAVIGAGIALGSLATRRRGFSL